MTATEINQSALEEFLGQAVSDAGAALGVLLTHIGDRLGLYRAMADSRPVSAGELAGRAGVSERLAQEWLAGQAAGGYVTYDPHTDRFRLPPEQAMVLADESSPALAQGVFDAVVAGYQSIDKEINVFRTGAGLTWEDHDDLLYGAVERAFRPGYRAHLVQEWIPALDGVQERLIGGGRVADVGCGHGSSTLMMAAAYPKASFIGYDYHAPSIRVAREAATQAGVADRVSFEVADATTISGHFDLIAFFDCWHDTADPLGTARAARQALADGGSVMLVEPMAGDRTEDNLTALGRFFYGCSAVFCTPCSISDGGPGLGAQAGEARTRALLAQAGFTAFRRVSETPLNVIYEGRA